jgi:hypothetical protein
MLLDGCEVCNDLLQILDLMLLLIKLKFDVVPVSSKPASIVLHLIPFHESDRLDQLIAFAVIPTPSLVFPLKP